LVCAAWEVRDMRRFGIVFALATMLATSVVLFAVTSALAIDVWPPH